jgi:hypothetical protein
MPKKYVHCKRILQPKIHFNGHIITADLQCVVKAKNKVKIEYRDMMRIKQREKDALDRFW